MVTMENLIDAYYATRQNKRRSADSVQFELHWQRNLVDLLEAINTRTLQPTAYTFITRKPKPREVFACDMATRIVHHYIDLRLRPIIEEELTVRTFNNRIGYGQVVAVNTLISDIYDVSKGFTKDAWIIKLDLAGYFPSADQEIVYQQLVNLALSKYSGEDKDDLCFMIQRAVFSYPQLHCYRKSPKWKWSLIPKEKSLFFNPLGIGGAIGHLIWQNAMNYYLNDIDHWLLDTCGLHYLRFVDDMVITTDNKEACLAFVIPEIRRRLRALHCTLHPKKFYCQHYTKGVNFIGSQVKRDRVYVSKRIIRNSMRSVERLSRKASLTKLHTFLQSANSYLGIFKTRNAFRFVQKFLAKIPPDWWKYCYFNRTRVCLQANEGYGELELLVKKHHVKLT